MPDETTAFLYVNLKDTIPWVLSLVRLGTGSVPRTLSENLRPLRTLTTWGAHDGTTTTFSVFLEIK